jgi:hypothetical protein
MANDQNHPRGDALRAAGDPWCPAAAGFSGRRIDMRVPQVTERMKEAPAHALRAVFAGIGQVLLVADRIRNRPVDGAGATSATAPAPATTAPQATSPSAASPAQAAPAAQDAPAPAPAQAAPAAPAPAASPAQDAPAPAASDLPVPGYDELSVASLRARMRSLDVAQLRALVDYESAHAARPAVLAMFERRIAKIEGGEA